MASVKSVGRTPISTTADTIISNAIKGAIRLFWIAVLTFVVVTALFSAYLRYSYVPVYKSSATFVISVNSEYNTETRYYDVETANQLAKTFPSVLKSGILSDIVANDLGLTAIPCTISAEAVPSTNLFTVSVTGRDAQLTYDVLQSVMENYPQVANFVVGNTELVPVDLSGVPTEPQNAVSYTDAVKYGILAAVAAYALAILIYVLTRATVITVDDITKLTNVKCIGTVPRVTFKKRSRNVHKNILITNNRISHSFVEGVRLVRTRIEKECVDRGAKVLLVTSALAGEGKTTLACNLALSLARRGNKVLLIDCDLRHPSVVDCINLKPPKFGIIHYLRNEASISDVGLKAANPDGLMIIPGVGYCKNAAELIDNDRMKALIKKMREQVDYIILDTSPCVLMSDAAILAKEADAAIMVIRQDYASKDKILDGIEGLEESGIPVIGCVLNNAEYGLTGYGYGGYYYGRYSYNRYGYGKYYGDDIQFEQQQ